MKLPRGWCPHCGRYVALRRGGIVREHRPIRNVPDARLLPICAGSGQPNAERRGQAAGVAREAVS